ncbi:LysR family transcriptional regulator [Pseudomonas sp. BN414]|uniref:TOBE domain-containing protein n=1 Tax=Pseudomonas sp. BN414 TaxID=2567888 RepID=UPI002455FD99|nr:TOBE domain-containing protein [Pseudomonas sp. BN414]MDH4571000.1 LysR family transcriptional regulator [Pseudomonas sp. BN414]
MTAPRFLARMSLETAIGAELSGTRIRLLEQIQLKGSINQAAKAVPISYKAAWEAVDTLNNLSPTPLVIRVKGGPQGGGTELTDYGRKVVAMYRALEGEYQATLDRLAGQLDHNGPEDIQAFQALMRRMRLNSSARNQFSGSISELVEGPVEAEVRIRLDPQTEIVTVVTRTSVENLGLAPGMEVLAMVKASSVMLSTERGVRMTARNQLWGEISLIHEGPVNNEVTLDLPSGRCITAVVTQASCETLDLRPGLPACAFFKASSVILASHF